MGRGGTANRTTYPARVHAKLPLAQPRAGGWPRASAVTGTPDRARQRGGWRGADPVSDLPRMPAHRSKTHSWRWGWRGFMAELVTACPPAPPVLGSAEPTRQSALPRPLSLSGRLSDRFAEVARNKSSVGRRHHEVRRSVAIADLRRAGDDPKRGDETPSLFHIRLPPISRPGLNMHGAAAKLQLLAAQTPKWHPVRFLGRDPERSLPQAARVRIDGTPQEATDLSAFAGADGGNIGSACFRPWRPLPHKPEQSHRI